MRKLLLLTGLSLVLSACGGGGGGSSSGSSSGSGGGTNPPPSGGSNNPPPSSGNCIPGTYISLNKANIVVQDVNGNILPKNSKGEWVANDQRVKIVIPYSTDAKCVGSGINFYEGNKNLGGDVFYSSPMTWYCFGDFRCEKSFLPTLITPTSPTVEYSSHMTYYITADISQKGIPWEAISDLVYVEASASHTCLYSAKQSHSYRKAFYPRTCGHWRSL